MPSTPVNAPAGRPLLHRVIARVLAFATVGVVLFWAVQQSSARLDASARPAGFGRGMLHGALMPLALPILLLGRDPTIYASHNTGRLYKLGYTAGVNGCGLVFFGFFFWRLNRLRRRLRGTERPDNTESGPTGAETGMEN
jgi:hypothetical protein